MPPKITSIFRPLVRYNGPSARYSLSAARPFRSLTIHFPANSRRPKTAARNPLPRHASPLTIHHSLLHQRGITTVQMPTRKTLVFPSNRRTHLYIQTSVHWSLQKNRQKLSGKSPLEHTGSRNTGTNAPSPPHFSRELLLCRLVHLYHNVSTDYRHRFKTITIGRKLVK
jgi:hypothetical protein